MKGPRPAPTKLKILRGNPGKRKLNDKEPVMPAGLPDCPDHLSKAARAEWDRVSAILSQAGLLTSADRAALALYCQAWDELVTAQRKLQREGRIIKTKKGYPILNPWTSVERSATERMMKCLTEFGMTPSSRSRLKVGPKEEVDPMDAFLNRGKAKP